MLFQADELKNVTADDWAQQGRIVHFTKIVRDLISFTDSVLIMRFDKSVGAGQLPQRLMANPIFRAQIRQVIADIRDREMELLVVRQRAYKDINVAFRNRFILLGTTFISIRYTLTSA